MRKMPLGPDEKNTPCLECQEIARQFNQSYAEAFERSKPASEVLYRLIGGAEDDVERAERFLGVQISIGDVRLARSRMVSGGDAEGVSAFDSHGPPTQSSLAFAFAFALRDRRDFRKIIDCPGAEVAHR
jgi:hypothetical protein